MKHTSTSGDCRELRRRRSRRTRPCTCRGRGPRASAASRSRGAAAGGHRDGDVARPGAGDQLAGEHQVEADVVAQRGEDRLIGGERPGRAAAPADRRPGEQRHQRGGIRGAAAVAEREHPPARGEPAGHLGCRRRDQLRGWRPRWTRRSAALSAALAAAEAARSAQQRVRVALLGVEERVQEVGRLIARQRPRVSPRPLADRRPGVDEHEVARRDRVDQHRHRRPRRPPRCAPDPARTTPRRAAPRRSR